MTMVLSPTTYNTTTRHSQAHSGFEDQYLALRTKEHRVYSDEELLYLPVIHPSHPHYYEWLLRKKSADRLLKYLQKKEPVRLLEVGCGNGWLCHQLAKLPGANITGVDINFTELQQAARTFSHLPGLNFMYTDIRERSFKPASFDCIVFAASIQYFPSFNGIIQTCLSLLKPGGEIHIIDSPFYKTTEQEEARQRSKEHYTSLGFSSFHVFYSHHAIDEIKKFDYSILYQPTVFHRLFQKHCNPFPWIRISKNRKT